RSEKNLGTGRIDSTSFLSVNIRIDLLVAQRSKVLVRRWVKIGIHFPGHLHLSIPDVAINVAGKGCIHRRERQAEEKGKEQDFGDQSFSIFTFCSCREPQSQKIKNS